ncbi:MAG TPA: acetyl-CoA hydrolase/transferase C-terminal domain-containing protein [Spirochaetota bacterium]|mgnify:CR=1 FL=1|nr:acetyl-CoA hydrolase/transferase C-terminal domain-containing protein [Spirochaetota bacterium]
MSRNYFDDYKRKLVSAAEAAGIVRSGDWVDYGFCINAANELDAALAKRKNELLDVNIRACYSLWPHHTLEADPEGSHFYWHSFHFSSVEQKYYNNGNLSYIPMKFYDCPDMIRNDCEPCRVLMLTVGPMDRHGYFSMGISASSLMASVEMAEYVIVEVNENIPRVHGAGQEVIHISQIDYVVEGSNPPIPVIPAFEATDVEKLIAGNVLPSIHDGSCIQLGVGGVPTSIGNMICDSDIHDLGVHTEMYVDSFMKMAEAGKISGARKNIDRYRQVMTFALGSPELYDYIDDNPGILAYPVEYTNNISIIAQLDNFVSINACIEVDLYGQVCSETIGHRHITGTGGQLDFVEGAYRSKGGQSFICMTSTYNSKNGIVSRIRPTLAPGTIVTDTRSAVHKIATEYGVANLKGKNLWQRAEALISIAHPDFRDDLVQEAEKLNIWRRSNRIN